MLTALIGTNFYVYLISQNERMMETTNMPMITGILIQDPEGKGFTAYFAEFPEVVAEGATEMDAKRNLFEALTTMLEIKRSESISHLHGKVSSFDYPLQVAS